MTKQLALFNLVNIYTYKCIFLNRSKNRIEKDAIFAHFEIYTGSKERVFFYADIVNF